jgi:hypothetical protein
MKKNVCLIVLAFFAVSTAQAVYAGPMLKLSPSSGSHDNGSTFDVVVGVDSGTAKSMAVDAFMTFDSSKLEVVSIDPVSNPAFVNTMGKNIYNSEGKFDMSFNPSGDAVLSESTAIKGDLATVKFRAKSAGTAEVKFTCTAGSTIDTNIFDITGNDVIDCASNVNASYTISGSSGAAATTTPIVNVVTTVAGELPRTGGFETTIGLMIFGLVGTLAGVALRWL